MLPLVLTTITKMFGVRKGLVERIKLTKSIVSPQHDWQLTFTYNLFCTINQASAVDYFHRIITINVLKVLPVSTRVRLLSVTNKTSSVFVQSIYIKRLEKRNVVSIPDPILFTLDVRSFNKLAKVIRKHRSDTERQQRTQDGLPS